MMTLPAVTLCSISSHSISTHTGEAVRLRCHHFLILTPGTQKSRLPFTLSKLHRAWCMCRHIISSSTSTPPVVLRLFCPLRPHQVSLTAQPVQERGSLQGSEWGCIIVTASDICHCAQVSALAAVPSCAAAFASSKVLSCAAACPDMHQRGSGM